VGKGRDNTYLLTTKTSKATVSRRSDWRMVSFSSATT
jgi:hypothetical protein